jgi:predicted transcriptional regulator
MTLDDFKNLLYKERQGVDAFATTVKQNMASILAIAATIAIPAVPAIFAANGMYNLTQNWTEAWRNVAAIAVAIGIEGAGLFLSQLATKTYSAWRKSAATLNEIRAIAGAVIVYTIIAIALISFSDVPTALKLVVGFIPILGIAFYIGMGFETDLANRLDEAEAEKRRKREERRAKRPSYRSKSVQKSLTKQEALSLILEYLNENSDASLSEIGRQIGRPKSTVGNYLSELQGAGKLDKNGNGWRVNE